MENRFIPALVLRAHPLEATNQIASAMHQPITLKAHHRLPIIIWEPIIMSQKIIILLVAIAIPILRMNQVYAITSRRPRTLKL